MPLAIPHIHPIQLKDSDFSGASKQFNRIVTLVRAQDPTGTITLRKKFIADVDKRYNALSKIIKESIVANDCFGLKERSNVIPLQRFQNQSMIERLNTIQSEAYKYMRDDQKVDAFMNWLEEQEEKGILEVIMAPNGIGEEPWSNIYVRSAYQKGLAAEQTELTAYGIELGVGPEGLRTNPLLFAFNQPMHAERVALIYTRVFRELKDVSRIMDTQISRELARGLASGEGAEAVAKRIDDRVKKIGRTRARLIARTEIVQTHSEGKLNEMERAEALLGETVYVQWWSALDSRVRDKHGPHGGWHGKVFTREQVRGMIGEPNCLVGDTIINSPSRIIASSKRWFEGRIITIKTSTGKEISCTPNHPIFGGSGFKGASLFDIGDAILCRTDSSIIVPVTKDKENVPAKIEEISESFDFSIHNFSRKVRLSKTRPHFHGDVVEGDVAIINTDCSLLDKSKIWLNFIKKIYKLQFFWGCMQAKFFSCLRSLSFDVNTVGLSSPCFVGMNNLSIAGRIRHLRPFKFFRLASGSWFNRIFFENSDNNVSGTFKFLGQFIDRMSGIKKFTNNRFFFDKVISVSHDDSFQGYVYNLETISNIYEANGVVNHNCRCTQLAWIESVHGSRRTARARAIEDYGTGGVPTPKQRKSKKYKEEQAQKEIDRRARAKAIRDRLKGK